MFKKVLFLILLAVLICSPSAFVLALKSYGSAPGLGQIVSGIANAAWIIFTVFAVVMFVSAGIMFLTSQGDAKKVETARAAVIWGIVGVVVGIIAGSAITFVAGLIGG
jgi:membrane protein implicated in regulation of membrane protease activity